MLLKNEAINLFHIHHDNVKQNNSFMTRGMAKNVDQEGGGQIKR